MFKNIVSKVPFSPALVGQLGFYARRLKQEEAVRRMGLVFTALALVVQSFAVFSPPESANAASEGDMIYGGISSKQEILDAYDNNKRFRDVMKYAGVTKQELKNTTVKTVNNLSYGKGDRAWKSWGWDKRYSQQQGEVKHNANGTTVYSRPNYLFNNTSYEKQYGRNLQVYHGHSDKLGEFAIMFACGNLLAPKLPVPPPPPAPPAPKPAASCSSLTAIRESSTIYRLKANATVKNGARISKYVFTVNDSSGTTVKKLEVSSGKTSVTTDRFSLASGSYQAKVTIKTSVGERTSDACQTTITVPPPGVLIDKKVDSKEHVTVGLNQQFKYQITVKNTGKVPLNNLRTTDTAPEGVVFVSSSGGKIENNGKSWYGSLAFLGIGQSKSYTITAKAPAYKSGLIRNVACVDTPTIPGQVDDCDDATIDLPEPTIKVCELATDRIITIKQSQFNASRHSKNLDDCKRIQVCDLASGTIITIRQPQFDKSKHSKDLSKCDDMQVCELESGEVITIKKHQFNEALHSTDLRDCIPQVASDKTATNLSQDGADAATAVAQAGDRIQYTVQMHNLGKVDTKTVFEEHLSDVLDYATLTDRGGGEFDPENSVLSWGEIELAPGEHTSRSFTVTVMEEIPATARGIGDPGSYDCVMTNTFGNSIDINVNCDAPKMVEGVVDQLPATGPGENILFAGVIASIVVYFYARSRQLATEVRLIRKDINSGVL